MMAHSMPFVKTRNHDKLHLYVGFGKNLAVYNVLAYVVKFQYFFSWHNYFKV